MSETPITPEESAYRLLALSSFLLMLGAARKAETMPEALRILRSTSAAMEQKMTKDWDNLRKGYEAVAHVFDEVDMEKLLQGATGYAPPKETP